MMNPESYRIHFQNIIVSLLELRVWIGEREIHMTKTELRMLLVFLVDPCVTITIDELVRRADLTSPKSLVTLVSRLRLLLDQQYIVTHAGGYSFVESPRERRERELETN